MPSLCARGVIACCITGNQAEVDVKSKVKAGKYQLVFFTPEMQIKHGEKCLLVTFINNIFVYLLWICEEMVRLDILF